MKASRSKMRWGVVVIYCCQTWMAISAIDEFDFKVGGPEDRVDVVEGAGVGAEVVEAACRLGGIVSGFGITGSV